MAIFAPPMAFLTSPVNHSFCPLLSSSVTSSNRCSIQTRPTPCMTAAAGGSSPASSPSGGSPTSGVAYEPVTAIDPRAWDMQLCSPSKINLFLRVTRRRADGFHDLASLFQTLSLHDKLYFRESSLGRDSMECNIPGIPTDDRNLIIRAFQTYREYTGVTGRLFMDVKLEKVIPHQAGLGGGSSNAATALWAINQMNGAPCSTQELIDLGAKFGSDISFFFACTGTAFCTGRGEVVNDVTPGLTCDYPVYVVKPPEGLSTGRVFQMLDIDSTSRKDPDILLREMQRDLLQAEFVNDLEKPSFELVPRLGILKQQLYEQGFDVVMMSGSGTSFFCIGHAKDEDFASKFAREHDVKIFNTSFQSRKSDELWYFE